MFIFVYMLLSLSTIIFSQESTDLKNNSHITYLKCHDREQLNFTPFPIDYQPDYHPANPTIAETFILTIPNGCAHGVNGIIIADNKISTDLIWPCHSPRKAKLKNLDLNNLPQPTKINGRVAVIAQCGSFSFYHWVVEVLSKLALLEMNNIEYDYLYVSQMKPYMKESLRLWGIDTSKIIEPCKEFEYIQADELIVPSLVNHVETHRTLPLGNYPSTRIINYLRQVYLPKIQNLNTHQQKYSKKIFISRNDAIMRRFTNEDDLFKKLQVHGFERYYLSKLSFSEQIRLFEQADTIVAAHGAGLIHLIFTQPGTQVIELFQARQSATYWYLSQSPTLQLHHTCIQTCPFDEKNGGHGSTKISQSAIDQIIETILALEIE